MPRAEGHTKTSATVAGRSRRIMQTSGSSQNPFYPSTHGPHIVLFENDGMRDLQNCSRKILGQKLVMFALVRHYSSARDIPAQHTHHLALGSLIEMPEPRAKRLLANRQREAWLTLPPSTMRGQAEVALMLLSLATLCSSSSSSLHWRQQCSASFLVSSNNDALCGQ